MGVEWIARQKAWMHNNMSMKNEESQQSHFYCRYRLWFRSYFFLLHWLAMHIVGSSTNSRPGAFIGSGFHSPKQPHSTPIQQRAVVIWTFLYNNIVTDAWFTPHNFNSAVDLCNSYRLAPHRRIKWQINNVKCCLINIHVQYRINCCR